MTDNLSIPDISAQQQRVSQAELSNKSNSLLNIGKNADMEKVEAVAKDFEAVFVSEMMKPMFKNLETEAPFGGGKGEEVFRGMLLQEYGKIISQTGSIGVADHVKATILQIQEEASNQSGGAYAYGQ